MIFVFGSNTAGIHGKGAALIAARLHGAKRGVGEGPQGDSYAIPTRNGYFQTLSPERIQEHVDQFLIYAEEHPELEFQVTAIGTGYAGLDHATMAAMFTDAPSNCYFDQRWEPLLPPKTKFWGSY